MNKILQIAEITKLSQLIRLMTKSLRDPSNPIKVEMNSFGGIDERSKECYGCAATKSLFEVLVNKSNKLSCAESCCIAREVSMEVAGNFSIYFSPCSKSSATDVDIEFIRNNYVDIISFEDAIDDLRTGWLISRPMEILGIRMSLKGKILEAMAGGTRKLPRIEDGFSEDDLVQYDMAADRLEAIGF